MKAITISIIIAVALIISGYIIYRGDNSNTPTNVNNVSVTDGKQIIDINAKGGYSPKASTAKAGMPTVIRVTTRGTFDCSSYVVIPGIGYSVHLPPTGEKEIEIPPQKAGSIMQVFCGMGMYNFQIAFD